MNKIIKVTIYIVLLLVLLIGATFLFVQTIFSLPFLQNTGLSKNNLNNIKLESQKTENSDDRKQALTEAIIGQDQIKFADNIFSLYYTEEINNGLAMYYSPNEEYFNSESKFIINQYGNKIKTKDLAAGIIAESKGRGAELFSPFTAPDDKGREAYYIAFREFIDERDENPTTVYLMKIFEDSGSTYSIVYSQDIEGKDKEEKVNKSEQWVIDNLIKYNRAIEKIDLSNNISLYNKNEVIFKSLAKASKYSALKWKTETIKEDNIHAGVDIEYPRFTGGVKVNKLNELIKGMVMKNLSKDKALVNDWIKNGLYWIDDQGNKQYEQNATDRWQCRDAKEYNYECSVNLSFRYKIYSIINDIVSLELTSTDYTGGGNGNHDYPITINYDLKTNKELKAGKLFCAGNYLDKLSALVRPELFKISVYDGGIFEDSIKPTEENFDKILLGNFGLTVVFPPYAVASGAEGVVRVFLPYSSVSEIVCLP